MSILYTIERHTHGWLICAAPGQRCVPLNVLDECMAMFPRRKGGTVIAAGIARHYNAKHYGPVVVFAVATPKGSAAWRAEIEASIADLAPHTRWWLGTDVGMSSAAMFAPLCPITELATAAGNYGNRSTPADADDLGRCMRLIALFPEWHGRLDEVAAAYPDTAWPRIIGRWHELEAADPKTQNRILNECRTPKGGGQ